MDNVLARFLAGNGRTASLQTAAARLPHEQPGSMGTWSIEGYGVERWQAMATPADPHGRIVLSAGGWLQVDLDDFAGWHPFIALAGEDAGRRLQVTTRYRWDGTYVEDAVDASFDATFGRYMRLGTASDGSLAANGHRSRILVAPIDGQPLTIADAWVGWMMTA